MIDWITDTATSSRFPIYTRANAEEIGPAPFPPLTWTLAWQRAAIPGTVDAWVHLGGFRREEFSSPIAEVYGCWGGYLYNQVSVGRVFGERAPGGDPGDIDRTYFGSDPDVPSYIPHPDDRDDELSAALGASLAAALTTARVPYAEDFLDEVRRRSQDVAHLGRLSDPELLAAVDAACEHLRRAWDVYIQVTVSASVGPGLTHSIAQRLGAPELAVSAFTAIGDVESAQTSHRIWELSRLVAASPALTECFDRGADTVLNTLTSSPASGTVAGAEQFRHEFGSFIKDFGHRSSLEYDLASPTWAMRPQLVTAMIGQVRRQSDARSPHARTTAGRHLRDEAVAALTGLAASDPETAETLRTAVASGQRFFRLREATKDALVRTIDGVRRPVVELGRRLTDRGALDAADHVFQLCADELEDALLGEVELNATLARRAAEFALLHHRVPPSIIAHGSPIPPIDEWPARGATVARGQARPTVLTGIGASPGIAEGPARLVHDLFDVDELSPGEILVCAVTDPSWSPLLMNAGAVVCTTGAEGSHAAVISREIGVPCVMSVRDALAAIDDGQRLRVDGTLGSVQVVQPPR